MVFSGISKFAATEGPYRHLPECEKAEPTRSTKEIMLKYRENEEIGGSLAKIGIDELHINKYSA